ncbi:MAG: hypothetical protein E6Q68_01785 [Polynucleobacter sp.]|nr:MAG: hypothetical protein E6Q68_01785 [Polynucleobacter sp.]
MPRISLFKSVSDIENPVDYELLDYLERTRDGEWQDIVFECRNASSKEERDAIKKKMPTATLSGLFSKRRDDGMTEHSEYLSMDIDSVENVQAVKNVLCQDKYVYSCFVSTSGNGLRALFKIEPSRHRDAFNGIAQYLFEKYEIICDRNGINVSKPYLVSFDPYLYISPDDVPVFKKYVKETVIKKAIDFYYTPNDFEQILNQISSRSINICENYNDWVRVGFAIAEQFGEAGRDYFHTISSQSAKYNHGVTEKQYRYCLKGRGTTKINISTFYYLCKLNGVNIYTEQTKTIIRTTRNGKKAGLSEKQIVENLSKFASINGTEKIVNQVFNSNSQESFEDDGDSVIEQLEMFINNSYSLRMNEVTGYVEDYGKKLSPSDLNSIFIAAKKLIPKLDYQLMIRLLKSDFVPTYNPFFEFFGSDGNPVILPPSNVDNSSEIPTPIIDRLASSIKNDDPTFTKYFVRKWIISIISAAHKVHSPLLLCLLGTQGTGKTEFFRRLLPPELSDYYQESKLDKEKDDELLMTESLIIMDDELGGKSKQDALKLKNMTSKQYFSLRRPYGDHNEKILRLAVLCGTSNFKEILVDQTGNRRVIPIEVHSIDLDEYNSIDKKEMMMEAYRAYRAGFDWRVGRDDMTFLNKDEAKYESISREGELIAKYFAPIESEELMLSTTDILVEIEKMTNQRLNITSISREMGKLGFVQKIVRGERTTVKKWLVKRTEKNNNLSQETSF